MILATSLLSLCWEFVTRHPGLVLVMIGVAGEVACDWNEMSGRLARAKKLSAILLVVGLAIEFIEAAKSDLEIATLNKEAANARLETAKLEQQVAETRTNVANVDPLNQPISDISAFVEFNVRNIDPTNLTPFRFSANSSLSICETTEQARFGAGTLPFLSSERVSPFKSIDIKSSHETQGYSIRYQMNSTHGIDLETVSRITNENFLTIDVSFLPMDSEIESGFALLKINSTDRKFNILPQKAFEPDVITNLVGYKDSFKIIATFGTNNLPVNRGPHCEVSRLIGF